MDYARGVAQLVEHRSPKPGVVSSSLAAPAKMIIRLFVKLPLGSYDGFLGGCLGCLSGVLNRNHSSVFAVFLI